MIRFLLLALAWLPTLAAAQVPAANRMPDGSRDLYVGAGVQVAPRYAGADSDRLTALPVVQFAFSNGLFLAGATLGWHLGNSPTREWGPLLVWQPRRAAEGDGLGAGAVTTTALKLPAATLALPQPQRLNGIDAVPARLLGGAFYNAYLSPQWRLTSAVLAGAGASGDGVLLRLGVQRLGVELGRHHSLVFDAGVDLGNRAYNQAYAGVSPSEAERSGYPAYQAGAGLRDVHLGARWTWTWSPAWLLVSGIEVRRLVDGAASSPLTVRATGVTASSAVAWRF